MTRLERDPQSAAAVWAERCRFHAERGRLEQERNDLLMRFGAGTQADGRIAAIEAKLLEIAREPSS